MGSDSVRAASAVLVAVAAAAAVLTMVGETGGGDAPNASSVALDGTKDALGSAAVPPPGPLTGGLRRADVLVIADETLPSRLRVAVEAVDGVRAAELLSVSSVPFRDRAITVAAVDPDGFRHFTPRSTARSGAVWRSVAAGEVALTHDIGRSLDLALGSRLAVRAGRVQAPVRVGAYAATVAGVDAIVNYRRGEQLGMTPDNALLLSVRGPDAMQAVQAAVGKRATVVPLAAKPGKPGGRRLAYLTGGAVAKAVGSFRYQYYPDGSVRPDPDWVSANIRTESVPLLGQVTCHRAMLPQLRSALAEVEARGLAEAIDAGDFGGCYNPRFIGHDAANGLSLHTWGIAVDLNVSGNQRGTAGEIDRDVVRIFKRWGFAWGGDWSWTDPMHFELAALVR